MREVEERREKGGIGWGLTGFDPVFYLFNKWAGMVLGQVKCLGLCLDLV